MKLDLVIMAGAETKKFLGELSSIVERMEQAAFKVKPKAASQANEEESEEEEGESETEAFTSRARKGKKQAASFDDDTANEEAEETEDDDFAASTKSKKAKKQTKGFDDDDAAIDEEEEAPKTAKKAKAPKLTIKDVNAACLAASRRTSRKKVLAFLEKTYDVKTSTELDPEQYAEVIEAVNEL